MAVAPKLVGLATAAETTVGRAVVTESAVALLLVIWLLMLQVLLLVEEFAGEATVTVVVAVVLRLVKTLSECTVGRFRGNETGGNSGLTVLVFAPEVTDVVGLGCTGVVQVCAGATRVSNVGTGGG